MSVVKSFSVNNGDMFYIRHNSNNFTLIDCNLTNENSDRIIKEVKAESSKKEISRFISTHPDEDHFKGIELLDDAIGITNFYVIKNKAIKDVDTPSFLRYCKLRDDAKKSFYIYKDCQRKWMNLKSDERGQSGINILWPDTSNAFFKEALAECDAGESYNNVSAVIRYSIQDNASILWLGDLETEFMEDIADSIKLDKTTIVFAAHHGRDSGKIPDSWLKILDPQVIVLGEAPSRHLHYYTGYKTITQNSAGDITMECVDSKVHFYVSKNGYKTKFLVDEGKSSYPNYIGSLTVETEYTLEP